MGLGTKLSKIQPRYVEKYDNHTMLKLISIIYWVGFFAPISTRQFKEKRDFDVIYVDTMAGSGVTRTRNGDNFCGSIVGSVMWANEIGFPFDKVLAVEIKPNKAKALEERLRYVMPDIDLVIFPEDVMSASSKILSIIKTKSISYITIDPEGFEGMSWAWLKPLLDCKGDAMITWFESGAWRMQTSSLKNGRNAQASADILTDLIGSETWKKAKQASELTDLFLERIKNETNKEITACYEIRDKKGKHYKMILLLEPFRIARELAMRWKTNISNRLDSFYGYNIKKTVDIKVGRVKTLKDFEIWT